MRKEGEEEEGQIHYRGPNDSSLVSCQQPRNPALRREPNDVRHRAVHFHRQHHRGFPEIVVGAGEWRAERGGRLLAVVIVNVHSAEAGRPIHGARGEVQGQDRLLVVSLHHTRLLHRLVLVPLLARQHGGRDRVHVPRRDVH